MLLKNSFDHQKKKDQTDILYNAVRTVFHSLKSAETYLQITITASHQIRWCLFTSVGHLTADLGAPSLVLPSTYGVPVWAFSFPLRFPLRISTLLGYTLACNVMMPSITFRQVAPQTASSPSFQYPTKTLVCMDVSSRTPKHESVKFTVAVNHITLLV